MDRFYRGLLSGLAGGIVMNIWSMFSYHILHFTTRRFLDWSAVILYGQLPRNWFEALYALLLQLLWVGLLGVIFAFLIRDLSTSKGLLIKGVFFGVISGFIIMGYQLCLECNILNLPHKEQLFQTISGVSYGV